MRTADCPLCGVQLYVHRQTEGYQIWKVKEQKDGRIVIDASRPVDAEVRTQALPRVFCPNEVCKYTQFYTATSLEWS